MLEMLRALQDAYGNAVDIEFTVNVGQDGDFIVNLLQCRPIRSLRGGTGVEIPAIEDESCILHTVGEGMGNDCTERLDVVVEVDPERYYRCAHALKPSVAALVGRANAYCAQHGFKAVLFTPGRLGTSSPELGVPTTFADISAFRALFEVAYSEAGYAPELSYGSHMFQDLVEADICYGAVLENETRRAFHLDLLDSCPDITDEVLGEVSEGLSGIVRVIDVRAAKLTLWHDSLKNETLMARE
jgi:pyruvate,water dikinase